MLFTFQYFPYFTKPYILLLLNHVIERGLTAPDDEKSAIMVSAIPGENLTDLKQLAEECLQKAGLAELREKLQTLNQSGK